MPTCLVLVCIALFALGGCARTTDPCPPGSRPVLPEGRCAPVAEDASAVDPFAEADATDRSVFRLPLDGSLDTGEGGAQQAAAEDANADARPNDPISVDAALLSTSGSRPQVVANAMGRAVVVWEVPNANGAVRELYWSVQEGPSGAWQTRKLTPTIATRPHRDAALAMSTKGDVVLAWRSADKVAAATLPSGQSSWRDETTFVNAAVSGLPVVRYAQDDNVWVCWASGQLPACASYAFYSNLWDNEIGLGNAMQPNQRAPFIMPYGREVDAVWVEDSRSNESARIVARRGHASGWRSGPSSVYEAPLGVGFPVGFSSATNLRDLSHINDDRSILLWHEATVAGTTEVRLAWTTPSGLDPLTVVAQSSAAHPGDGRYASIVASQLGFMAVWSSDSGLQSRVLTGDEGGGGLGMRWGPLTPVAAGASALFEAGVQLVADGAGTSFALWVQKTGDALQLVYASARGGDPTPTWSEPRAIANLSSQTTLTEVGQPVLAAGPDGKALAVWADRGAQGETVQALWLDAL